MIQMSHFSTLGRFDNQPNSSRLWGVSCLYSPSFREKLSDKYLEGFSTTVLMALETAKEGFLAWFYPLVGPQNSACFDLSDSFRGSILGN